MALPGGDKQVTLQDQVAEEARALLARRRISGRQVGAALGWSPAYLSRRLTGQIPFSVADLEALAGLLDVPITTFFPAPGSGVILRGQCRRQMGLAA